MVVVYCGEKDREVMTGALAGLPVAVHTEWTEFEHSVRRGLCLVVVFEFVEDHASEVNALHALAADFLNVPLVLVTRRDQEGGRVPRLKLDWVVWYEEFADTIKATVIHALSEHPRWRLAAAVEESPNIERELRHGFADALRAPNPPLTVKKFAHVIGLDENQAEYRWRVARPSTETPLSRVLQAIVLHRALELRLSGLSWSAAAAEVGHSAATIRRAARRILRVLLEDLSEADGGRLLAWLREQLLPDEGL